MKSVEHCDLLLFQGLLVEIYPKSTPSGMKAGVDNGRIAIDGPLCSTRVPFSCRVGDF